jgi:precorrin-6B methylase 1
MDYADGIRQEYQKYLAQDVIHNSRMQREILETWERDRPKMYQELKEQGILEELAFVVQERMWQEDDRLTKAGMSWTDAREIATASHLMLTPEETEEEMDDEEE